MARSNVVTINNIEVNKTEFDKIKKALHVRDNAEAVKKALDLAFGKVELENIFLKSRGVKIKKLYA
jgi:hypothetical protein